MKKTRLPGPRTPPDAICEFSALWVWRTPFRLVDFAASKSQELDYREVGKKSIRILGALLAVTGASLIWSQTSPRTEQFEGQEAIVLSNGKLDVTVLPHGSVLANIALADDPQKLSPLWNPIRLGREAGRGPAQFNGIFGHFPCVDGFGQPSADERTAGLPQHGEAHGSHFAVTNEPGAVSMRATLPIVQEVFTRIFRMVPGESVLYVDSQLENLLGFDRPVNWAEHATVSAPFVAPGKTTIALSGSRSQNRDYTANQQQGRGGGGRGGSQRRLVPGKDFTWPMAEGLEGSRVDMSVIPDNPHYTDHAATLMDPSQRLEWVTALNTEKKLVYGYVFRREDYPWIQHWGNFPSVNALVRGIEFGTQPYDVSRRDVLNAGPLFSTPTFRWLPAKSKIESHFIVFYSRVPEGFGKVDDVRLENGQIVILDNGSNKRAVLAASRGL